MGVSRLSPSAAHPGTLLLDFGSGIGNVTMEAALPSGCSALGIELMGKCAGDDMRTNVGRVHGR